MVLGKVKITSENTTQHNLIIVLISQEHLKKTYFSYTMKSNDTLE